MDVLAAVARAPQADFSLETVQLDAPRADEILVRIVGVGLCHTDLVMRDGGLIALPAVLGHEGSGIVEAVGADVMKVAPGDRVTISFRSCGQCANCGKGLPAYCLFMPALNYAGVRADGSHSLSAGGERLRGNFFGQSSFASHALTYERNVVKVPDDVPLELMGPLGCGVQTGAGAVMRSFACPAGSSLLVLGGGAVGLSAVMGAVIRGCATIVVVEPHAARRTLALELGATHVIDPAVEDDVPGAVRRVIAAGVDYAIDTTGRPDILHAVTACLAPRGTLGLVGIAPPGTPLPGDVNAVITLGHRIIGIVEGDSDPDTFIPDLIEHYRQGRLPFDKLIRTYPFGEINRAIADQNRGDCVKVVLLVGAR